MKLRVAKKIIKAVGKPDGRRYTDHQVGTAERRLQKTQTAKEAEAFFIELCGMVHAEAAAGNPRAVEFLRWCKAEV